ncbi:Protein AUXIN RESPONSE 4 [Striga hermonthica]|uniref:Protein AUXIN RESPONSE 4 n=1 Tax=Striga hermonthica TaxID=68872 RepID=A0A9N7MVS4_STRHE|nr:Protein AUXIN RESPONSE 4 [Striga hermonthica]
MAIITEEPVESPKPQLRKSKAKPKPKPEPEPEPAPSAPSPPKSTASAAAAGNPFQFCHVLIVHGLGCSSFAFRDVVGSLGRRNVHAIAIDLPGSGFSDKSIVVSEEYNPGGAGLWEVYEEIKEKGLFWGFDQLVEQGYVDFEENDKDRASKVRKRDVVKSIELGSEEMGRVLGQVVDSMGLTPVDLVLHDSALALTASWIAENRASIRSLTILDGGSGGPAFPLLLLELPLVRELVLGSSFVFEKIVASCCMGSADGGGARVEVDAHRVLLKGRDGRKSVVGMGKKLNLSFDLSEWGNLDEVKLIPIRVIWSDKWVDEGRIVADALPFATLVTHSGGRWTQEQNAEEVADKIYEFVSSLPKVTKQVLEKPMQKNLDETFGEDISSGHHHHHHHAHAGYMDAYGMGQGYPA